MDTLLKPARLDVNPNSPSAAKEWKHWHRTFTNFIEECKDKAPDKFRTLINYVSHNIYEYIEDCKDYDSAIEALQQLFLKTPNEIFARHLLATRQQKSGETLTELLQELKRLSKDCNFKRVSAEQYSEEMVRDSFINGLSSPIIRQRLLENSELNLKSAFDQAYSLDLAQRNAEAYVPAIPMAAAMDYPAREKCTEEDLFGDSSLASTSAPKRCYFCGDSIHSRKNCPARNSICHNCGKKGHYAKVCKSKTNTSTTASMFPSPSTPALCSIVAECPDSLKQASMSVTVCQTELTALFDSGSSDNFINDSVVKQLNLKVHQSTQNISMALTSLNTNVTGYCLTDITLNQHTYPSVRLGVLKDLCSDIILGQDFQKQHKSIIIECGGPKPELVIPKSTPVCALPPASLEEPSLFANLLPDCHRPNRGVSARWTKISFRKRSLNSSQMGSLSQVHHLGEHKLLSLKIHLIAIGRGYVWTTPRP